MAELKTTPEFKEAFVQMLAELPNLTVVCKLLGISPGNIAIARKKDKDFDNAVREAVDRGYDMIEEEARRRAVDGVLEPVFYRGEEVGKIRKYSDQLLITLLKGYKPKRFNPGVKVTAGNEGEKITMSFHLGGD